MRFTGSRGDAAGLADKGIKDRFTHIISVGGDGTSSEIVNVIAEKDVVFGVIPMGSGNDFPKACGIPLDLKNSLENLKQGSARKVDVGQLDERIFINGLGIGLDGAVAHRFGRLKMFGGFAGYLLGAVIEAFGFEGFQASCIIDSEETSGKYLLCGACNGPFQGGKFRLAPEASVLDGLLDIYFIDDMSAVKRLIKIPEVLRGDHTGMPEVRMLKIREARLRLGRKLPAHLDGEPLYLESGEYKIKVMERAVNVILPGK